MRENKSPAYMEPITMIKNSIIPSRQTWKSVHNKRHRISMYGVLMAVVCSWIGLQLCTSISYDSWKSTSNPNKPAKVSAIILTYKNHRKFFRLLVTVIDQKYDEYELIVADTGCLPQTRQYIDYAFFVEKKVTYKYKQLCHNPGYGMSNNEAVKLVDPSSEYILFLNDDIVLKGNDFIADLVKVADSKRQWAGAVGCSMRASTGDKLQESGSIVWRDGSALSFGRDSTNLHSSEFSYPRPVDYVSGACLMIRKDIFLEYGGFDVENFPNYYEDTDLQLHIQHELHQQVWLAPRAVALHDEHGSFGEDLAVKKMQAAQMIFYEKWKLHLLPKHLMNPYFIEGTKQKEIQILKASDVRARDFTKARILYLDAKLPSPSQGGGFGRSFDNLSMLAELGHRITVVSYNEASDSWCDPLCRDKIQEMGIEVFLGPWEEIINERIEFYDVVLISRSSIFALTHEHLRKALLRSLFVIVYDTESFGYRRDAEMLRLYNEGLQWPSIIDQEKKITPEEKELMNNVLQKNEIKLLGMADVVVAVSEKEQEIAFGLNPIASIKTVGHIMNLPDKVKPETPFHKRNGILFVASFDEKMYYNGDAIWYFLEEIFPKVLEQLPQMTLTIAGRGIPKYLTQYAVDNGYSNSIIFNNFLENLYPLFEMHKIFIAPHLYGSGIQFKISEALSFGIPCVLSKLSAEGFGITNDDRVACIGENPELFSNCIVSLHLDSLEWMTLQANGRSFIQRTHNRKKVMGVWSEVIQTAKDKYNEVQEAEVRAAGQQPIRLQNALFSTDLWQPTKSCPEGEALYAKLYPDVGKAVNDGMMESSFQHWIYHGRAEGRTYACT